MIELAAYSREACKEQGDVLIGYISFQHMVGAVHETVSMQKLIGQCRACDYGGDL